MKNKICISDFRFKLCGYGQYYVTYTSPITDKHWTAYITDMTIIDATKNADEPKIKDLVDLKFLCKTDNNF